MIHPRKKKPKPEKKPNGIPHVPPSGSPFWAFMNTLLVFVFVTVYSYYNAQHFDNTEIKLILYCTLSWVGVESLKLFRPKEKK